MSKGLASTTGLERSDAPGIAASAVVIGEPTLGARSFLSEGAVVRAEDGAVAIGAGSAVIENCVVIGTAAMPTTIGRRTVFGHRCLAAGTTVGDLCEIGNPSISCPAGDSVIASS